MPERDMTPDARERFEREEIHDDERDPSGPASENEDVPPQPNPTTVPVVTGNPD